MSIELLLNYARAEYERNMTDSTRPSPLWFVTGATSGIGLELVRQALRAGERVVAVARNVDGLPDSLGDLGIADLYAVNADVRDEAAVQEAVDRAVDVFGRIDFLANNAGYGLFGAVEESTDAQARAIFDTNVFGILNVLRAALPVLRRQRSGHILEGSSFYGQISHAGVGLLSATKYAVEGLSDALASEVAPLGIKVTLIQPSFTATNFLGNLQAAENTEPDYDQTVREVYKSVGEMPASAFVTAQRITAGIRAAAASENPPLRLALGSSGARDMRTGLTARLAELDKWVEITNAVDG
jgi:NAD(P)-dependent dehydrogenase (short-subunit alcohol dehydrogenase family)